MKHSHVQDQYRARMSLNGFSVFLWDTTAQLQIESTRDRAFSYTCSGRGYTLARDIFAKNIGQAIGRCERIIALELLRIVQNILSVLVNFHEGLQR